MLEEPPPTRSALHRKLGLTHSGKGLRAYQHCREKHLHCCLSEFDFRHHRVALGVNDQTRAAEMDPSTSGILLKVSDRR